MSTNENKQHVSVVVCGHVDAGKSTTTGHLIFELGGISDREMSKLRQEAEILGKSSFAFAFYMDKTAEERARGITIQCTTKEFFTENYHYTIVDAPGHSDFIKNMITGAAQADVGLLMVPADAGFGIAIQKGDPKANEIQGQTRQHARLLNLLGIKHLIVGVNKMDSETAGYKEERFIEVRDEMKNMLQRVGWKKDFIDKSVAIIPMSGWVGDNLIKKSDNMSWWKGQEIEVNGSKSPVTTLLDALNNIHKPERKFDAPLRAPVSGIYKIKGVGDVITARVEQGKVSPGEEVAFLPTHTASNPCTGKVFTVEMHHNQMPSAGPGDNVGLNIKGLDKGHMPNRGDIMVLKKDVSLGPCKRFTAQVQVLEHPGELKVGYSPVGYVRTAHSAMKIVEIKWRMGKETGNTKVPNPPYVKGNDVAEIVFEPMQPIVVDKFSNTEGLGRLAIFEGSQVQMLGKIVDYTL
jgi:elongation factor 1-alpha